MDIRSLKDEKPVEIVNRNPLFIKRDYEDESKGKPKNGKEYCEKKLSSSKLKYKYIRKICYRKKYLSDAEKAKKAREEKAKKYREERARKAREEKAKKDREEKAKKDREEKAKKAREEKAKKDREEKARKDREEKARKDKEKLDKKKKVDPNNKNNNGGDDGDNNNNNNNNNGVDNNPNNNGNDNNNNNDGNNDGNNDIPKQTGTPELSNAPTNSYQTPAATFTPTYTNMSNTTSLPSEDGRQKLSVAGISVITMILVGVIVLVALAVYRKRYNLRRGAVRLYDEPDQNDSSVMPRYLSNLRSLRIPSMPPKVQLTRLSSATILFPFRENNPAPSINNPVMSVNNLNNNNNYLSPYTRVHNLSSPNSSSSGGLTVNDKRDHNSQKTDSVQSQESYTSLESSFPIPPQRAFDDSYNTTPTSATFGDMYKLKNNLIK